jgi:Mrp family chromosome partitioning ATPase
MAKQKKVEQKRIIVETDPLVLQSADGVPVFTVPALAVASLRHMVTRLANESAFPAQMTMLAALPEEGVTFITAALATTIAHDLEKRVCVVELNWYRPGLLKLLNGMDSAGIASVLDGVVSINDVMVQTQINSQWVAFVPAGEIPIARRPIVARSAALRELVNELGKQFDYVLLDVPALRVSSDAIPLTKLGQAACLVVRQGTTPTTDVKRALDDVKNAPMIGVILNRVHVTTPKLLHTWISGD